MGDGAPGPQFVGDIAGEQDFLDGKAEHISGLEANGDRLSITLVDPSPDFLARLSLPIFCPVPVGTRALPGAAVGHPAGFDGDVPSAGPYYLLGRVENDLTILKRNPNYRGPRPHAL